ncbi:ATP-dependent RNA helicase DeaD [Rubripirellula amarantea]|uniref:RNA helicase n=1 Tax=Rubripirellula amarantea TaxID=2527999 RepID=A0A5C5WJ60_9BACT|nr:DEAD/DEAH box helicase [Rubripirellula amarantea]TWT50788.1 ATP-dependent RNA helicase DeaD [Rubripirellula amarantea]
MNLSDLSDVAHSGIELEDAPDTQINSTELDNSPEAVASDDVVVENTPSNDALSSSDEVRIAGSNPETVLAGTTPAETVVADTNASVQSSDSDVATEDAASGLVVVRKVKLKLAKKKAVKPVFNKKATRTAADHKQHGADTPVVSETIQAPVRTEAQPVAQTAVASVDGVVAPNADTPVAESPVVETPVVEEVLTGFAQFKLPPAIQAAIESSGYSEPSAIQTAIIPPMLKGRDVIAQSQTGSGKTAAFALPVLANLSKKKGAGPQALVLAPTRELAMQVAKSFETYAGQLKGFAVTAIYGGQDYEPQRRALRDGVSVVVGTPGRVIDHIKRGTLKLDGLKCLVLDEADEMLNMGFLEDVEFVLDQCPDQRQIALFSATMPDPIRRIADQYLTDAEVCTIKSKSMTAESIRQRAIFTSAGEKLELLKRVLESEETDGVIVFAKTKESTTVIADKLARAHYSVAALNGDMPQATRQRTVGSLKNGKIDIIVATDVAARGLDVPRISHVINFDLPHDQESYVHRIGRTGRAGRSGEAILFLTPSSRGRLRSIERMTNQSIEIVEWPSTDDINKHRVATFKSKITKTLAERDITFFENLINEYMEESGKPLEKVAAALAEMLRGGQPFLLQERAESSRKERKGRREDREFTGDFDDRPARDGARGGFRKRGPVEAGMRRYRVEVGKADGVRPGNLVGAIANEANLDSKFIGQIHIDHNFTTVDLPDQLPAEALRVLENTWVMGKKLQIRPDNGPPEGGGGGKRPFGGKGGGFGGKKKGGPKKGFGKGKR